MKIRTKKVFDIFGKYYGIKYMVIYWLHKNLFISVISKKETVLKYKGHRLYVRLYSRDLDFIESIYIGQKKGGRLQGEYDLREDGNCDSFLDLGANIGLFTIMFATKYPDRLVIAVEPEKSNFSLLRKNTNGLKNVICLNKAIWYRNAWVKVHESNVIVYPSGTPSEGGYFVGECDKADIEGIRAVTINDIMKKYRLRNFLCKMDIEGAEYKLFGKGKCGWLENCKTLVIETHDRFSSVYDENNIFVILENSHQMKKTLGENKVFVKIKEEKVIEE